MNKIIGLERKQGEYQGNKYDNTIIYFVTDDSPNVTGFKGGFTKCKTSMITKATGIPVNDFMIMIDKGINFVYDFTMSPPVLIDISIFDNK